MQHLLKTSGGAASAVTGDLIVLAHGPENLVNLFTDTLIEDDDLYRFLVEWTGKLYGVEVSDLAPLWREPTPVWVDESARAEQITALRDAVVERLPNFHWIIEGRNPWQIFFDERMMGSSRLDPCSKKLKRQIGDRYIEERWSPEEVEIHFGIGHHEAHRFNGRWVTKGGAPVWKQGIRERMLPWIVRSPLIDRPELTKAQMLHWISAQGIAPPRIYTHGFSTNNCGGACVKAGHGSWERLLHYNRAYYLWWEEKEQEFRRMVGKDVSILKCRRGGRTRPLTLRSFRKRVEANDPGLAEMLVGVDGCGGSCALPDEG